MQAVSGLLATLYSRYYQLMGIRLPDRIEHDRVAPTDRKGR